MTIAGLNYIIRTYSLPGHGFRDVMRATTFEYARYIAKNHCKDIKVPEINEVCYVVFVKFDDIFCNH